VDLVDASRASDVVDECEDSRDGDGHSGSGRGVEAIEREVWSASVISAINKRHMRYTRREVEPVHEAAQNDGVGNIFIFALSRIVQVGLKEQN